MRKIIFSVIGGVVIGALVSPIVGMAIGSTRSLILGLAPEDAVLELADKIDQTDAKSDETSALVESLQAKVAEQDGRISEYQVKLAAQEVAQATTAAEQTAIAATVASQSQCNQLYGEQPLCRSDSRYRTKAAFDKMFDDLDFSKEEKEKRTKIFNKCQGIIAKCG